MTACICESCAHYTENCFPDDDFSCPYWKPAKDDKKIAAHSCDNCGHIHGTINPGQLSPCMQCIRGFKDHWIPVEPKLPDKHEGLTWWEADKLWHAGWDMRCGGSPYSVKDWDEGGWSAEYIRATDWYVVGRREGK